MVVDSTGRIVMLNAQMTRTFGYPPNELIGEPVEILGPRSDFAAGT